MQASCHTIKSLLVKHLAAVIKPPKCQKGQSLALLPAWNKGSSWGHRCICIYRTVLNKAIRWNIHTEIVALLPQNCSCSYRAKGVRKWGGFGPFIGHFLFLCLIPDPSFGSHIEHWNPERFMSFNGFLSVCVTVILKSCSPDFCVISWNFTRWESHAVLK